MQEKKEGEAEASDDKAAEADAAAEKEPEEKPKMKEVKRKLSRPLNVLKKPLVCMEERWLAALQLTSCISGSGGLHEQGRY